MLLRGQLSGASPVAGTYNVTIQATDSTPITPLVASASFRLSIAPPPFQITTSSIPAGITGLSYSASIASVNGVAPLVWSCPSGCGGGLTITGSGILLNASTGALNGTPVTGTYNFTVQATDALARVATATLRFAAAPQTFKITTTSVPATTAGAAYSTTLATSGGTAPITWSCTPLSACPEDMLNWSIMGDPLRKTSYLSGSAENRHFYMDADGQKDWTIKGNSGNPWDIRLYDPGPTGFIKYWITENGDETGAYTNPKAYKRYLTPVPLMPRFFVPGTVVTTITPGPNTIHRTINCDLDGEAPINIGQIKGVLSGPTTIDFGGQIGAQPTLQLQYHYGFQSGSGLYNSRETYSYVKGYGVVEWDLDKLVNGVYVRNLTKPDPNLSLGTIPSPVWPCGTSAPGWVGGTPGAGGNVPYPATTTPVLDTEGLALSPAGVISGATPGPQGTVNVTVQAKDANGLIATQPLSLVVNGIPAPKLTSITISADILTIVRGNIASFTAIGTYSDGTVGRHYFEFWHYVGIVLAKRRPVGHKWRESRANCGPNGWHQQHYRIAERSHF